LIALPEDSVTVVEKMIEFLYTANYTVDDTQASPSPSNLTLHAELYAIADKYGLPSLAGEAKSQFLNTTTSTSWDAQDFLNSIYSIYNLTPESDRGLRDVAINCARSHSRELFQGSVRELLQAVSLKVPDFAFDLLGSFIQTPVLGRCSTCGPNQKVECLQLRCLRCGRGGAHGPL
jgi:hypothetical protein